MSDDHLALLMERLGRARDVEAAAQLDVRDRKADEATAAEKRERAERCLKHAKAKVEEAWRAVRAQIDAQTHSMFEGELEG